MRRTNPLFIPRNHLVEAALNAATERQDYQPFEDLLDVVLNQYEDRPGVDRYATPARPPPHPDRAPPRSPPIPPPPPPQRARLRPLLRYLIVQTDLPPRT